MLKLATVFSGIGAVEHALKRMSIPYEIVFACDNGDVDVLSQKIDASISGVIAGLERASEELDSLILDERFSDQREAIVERLDGLQNDFDRFINEGTPDLENKRVLKRIRDFSDRVGMIFELITTLKIHNDLHDIKDYAEKKAYIDKI